MARETQKEKIERLEKELLESKKREEELYNQILKYQDEADNNFTGSPIYKDMQRQIETLKISKANIQASLKAKDEYIQKLINEIQHNSRNAGRKKRFSDNEINDILKDRASMTINELAKKYKCSTGLIHKLINE